MPDMPPYCERHRMHHSDFRQCERMTRDADRAQRAAERDRIAQSIADDLIAQTVPADTDPETRALMRDTAYRAALRALPERETRP